MAIGSRIGSTELPSVEPWTVRPNQARVIERVEGVRRSLARFARHFLAGTQHGAVDLLGSRFVLTEDPDVDEQDLQSAGGGKGRLRLILFGEHTLKSGAVVETRHEVQRFADDAQGYLLESLDPAAYGSHDVLDVRDMASITALVEADQNDADVVGLS